MSRASVLARHLLAIAVLPLVVTVIVPVWIGRTYGVDTRWPADLAGWSLVALGSALLLVGGALFSATVSRFAGDGEGTLGPWDPPRKLVVTGLYRHVRNPMISGVLAILFGEAALFRSLPLAAWAVAFLAINLTYIPLVEEPGLARRFGDDYERYRKHVPRFLPRRVPWEPGDA